MSLLDTIIDSIRATPGFNFEKFDLDGMVARLDDETVAAMYAAISEEEERIKFRRFENLFPDEGRFPRHLYPRHLEFFRVGAEYRERCFLAANRVGKTVGAAYEATCHLTGRYPHWWEGRRFKKPIRAWVAGATNETTRDIIQLELLGKVIRGHNSGTKSLDGSGIIPRECLGDVTWKSGGVIDLVDTVEIQHVSGGMSSLGLKSYEQGRKAFEGTAKELIWLDEEVDISVYGECLIRTATTQGILILTFTPLKGLSETVLQFMPSNMRPGGS